MAVVRLFWRGGMNSLTLRSGRTYLRKAPQGTTTWGELSIPRTVVLDTEPLHKSSVYLNADSRSTNHHILSHAASLNIQTTTASTIAILQALSKIRGTSSRPSCAPSHQKKTMLRSPGAKSTLSTQRKETLSSQSFAAHTGFLFSPWATFGKSRIGVFSVMCDHEPCLTHQCQYPDAL